MKNVKIMQFFKTQKNVDKGFPDVLLIKRALFFLVSHDLLIKIAVIWKLHDDAV